MTCFFPSSGNVGEISSSWVESPEGVGKMMSGADLLQPPRPGDAGRVGHAVDVNVGVLVPGRVGGVPVPC